MAETRTEATLAVSTEGVETAEAQFDSLGDSFRGVGDDAAQAEGRLASFDDRLGNAAAGADALGDSGRRGGSGLREMSLGLESTLKPMDESLKGFDAIKGRLGQLQGAVEVFSGIAIFNMVSSLGGAVQAMVDFTEAGKEAKRFQKELNTALADTRKELEDVAGGFLGALTAEREMVIQRILLRATEKALQAEVNDLVEQSVKKRRKVAAAAKANEEAIRKAAAAGVDATVAANTMNGAMAQAFAGGTQQGANLKVAIASTGAALRDAQADLKAFNTEGKLDTVLQEIVGNSFALNLNKLVLDLKTKGLDKVLEGLFPKKIGGAASKAIEDEVEGITLTWEELGAAMSEAAQGPDVEMAESEFLRNFREQMEAAVDPAKMAAAEVDALKASMVELAEIDANTESTLQWMDALEQVGELARKMGQGMALAAANAILFGDGLKEGVNKAANAIAQEALMRAIFAGGMAIFHAASLNPVQAAGYAKAAAALGVAAAAAAAVASTTGGLKNPAAKDKIPKKPAKVRTPSQGDFGNVDGPARANVVNVNQFSGHFYDTQDGAARALGGVVTRGQNMNAGRSGRQRIDPRAIDRRSPRRR
jgi:hypothetical protein